MFGQNISVESSFNGHYSISILPKITSNFDDTEQVLIFEENETIEEKRKKLVKLHKQFGHTSSSNLLNLMKNAGVDTKNISKIVEEITKQCNICKLYKKPLPRPAVSIPKSLNFNEMVAMDLHQLGDNLWYLHFIDEFSRFSNGVVIKSKQSNIIIKIFLKHWISIFGIPDNGGEFASKDFIDFCQNFNIKIKTSAAESPWNNGICEGHNAIITEILLKVKEDSNCDWETALAWALSAKNSLINVIGFSLHQIVFGKNIKISSVYVNQLSTDLPENEIVIRHLNLLLATRQAFITIDSSRKLKLALRKQTRQARDFFEPGSEVYFKRNIDQKWRGPGIVIGQDGTIVFIRQGGLLYKVHCSRTQKICDFNLPSTIDLQSKENNMPSLIEKQVNKSLPIIYDSCNDTYDNNKESSDNQDSHNENDDMKNLHKYDIDEVTEQLSNISINDQNVPNIKKGRTVSISLNDENYIAEILSRAGKATAKYKNVFNEQDHHPSNKLPNSYVDFDKPKSIQIIEE